jgi:hypothetical protein
MDTLQELTRRKGIIANNIVSRVHLPDMTEGLPVFHESEFQKAIAEGQIEAFTVENVSQFKRNLEKAIAEAGVNTALIEELEKAGKDLSKLVKVKKQDKRGKMTTVYVRQGEKAKEGGDGKKSEASGEQKTITHHEGGSTKIVSNGLDVGAVSAHTGEVLKRYKADKPEEVEKYAKHLAIEHNIPVEEKKKEEPDYHSLGRVLSHDFDHVKKHLGEKYVSNDGKRIDQHAIMADHPGDKLKEAAEKLDSAKKNTNNKESNKHKDHGKTFPIDWDGPSKVKVVGSDDKQVHVKRVGKDGKEMEGDEHSQSYSHDEWEDEKRDGESLHKQDPKAFDGKENTPDYSHIQEWVGDHYSNEEIHSIFDTFGGEKEMNKKFKYESGNRTQAGESAHIDNIVEFYTNKLKAEPHRKPKGLTSIEVGEILWGIGMNAQNPVKNKK